MRYVDTSRKMSDITSEDTLLDILGTIFSCTYHESVWIDDNVDDFYSVTIYTDEDDECFQPVKHILPIADIVACKDYLLANCNPTLKGDSFDELTCSPDLHKKVKNYLRLFDKRHPLNADLAKALAQSNETDFIDF